MRVDYTAAAVLALAVAAAGISATVAGAAASGPAFKQTPVARHSRIEAPAQGRAIRLAQNASVTSLGWEQTTGNPSVAPFKWVGLLKNRTSSKNSPNGWDCTAQFITPNVLLTAGHCLVDLTGGLPLAAPDPSKISFLLQYQDGDASQTFNAVCAAANPLWTLPANYAALTQPQQAAAQNAAGQHDFGMVLVNGASATGAMPYALDWKGKFTGAVRVGYPGDILNADIVQYAPGIVFFADAIPLPSGFNLPHSVVQWGPVTDATHGMSGGAWIANMSKTEGPGKNVLIGVTSSAPQIGSTAIPLFPGGTWAAYLTAAEFNPLLAFVSNGCK